MLAAGAAVESPEDVVEEPVGALSAGVVVEAGGVGGGVAGALAAVALATTACGTSPVLAGVGALATVLAAVGVDTGGWGTGAGTVCEVLGMLGAGGAASVTTGAEASAWPSALVAPED